MVKVLTRITCHTCNGIAFLPTEEEVFIVGWKYTHHITCPTCKGRGELVKWLTLSEIAQLLEEAARDNKRPRKGML
jgi:DnaJ-class molecular chaperone